MARGAILARLRDAAAYRVRRGRDGLLDVVDTVTGGRDALLPPRRLLTDDYSDFGRLGREFRDIFIRLGGLRPEHAVLDVGCGPGRMAVPLTDYLSSDGRYEGFDMVADEVRWCQQAITPRFPNFRFTLVDVYNRRYNPRGAVSASEFRFPYEDEAFDFAFLTSVFTHMLAPDVEHYLDELRRVTRRSGRGLVTGFLLTEQSRSLIASGKSRYSFSHPAGPARVNDAGSPEAAVAYPEEWLATKCEERGLRVESTHPGDWCGRNGSESWQDIVILRPASG
jgi:SAM-dependent methyltransferase